MPASVKCVSLGVCRENAPFRRMRTVWTSLAARLAGSDHSKKKPNREMPGRGCGTWLLRIGRKPARRQRPQPAACAGWAERADWAERTDLVARSDWAERTDWVARSDWAERADWADWAERAASFVRFGRTSGRCALTSNDWCPHFAIWTYRALNRSGLCMRKGRFGPHWCGLDAFENARMRPNRNRVTY